MLLEDEEKFEEEETDSEEANDESPVEVSEEEESKEVGNVIEGVEEGIKGGLGETEIGSEIKNSFLDYAMSVIVSRALPDARDGFKQFTVVLYMAWLQWVCIQISRLRNLLVLSVTSWVNITHTVTQLFMVQWHV